MADNSAVQSNLTGRSRYLDRLAAGIKTLVVQLDLGGQSSNSEKLIVAGRQVCDESVPVTLASDQPAILVRLPDDQAALPVTLSLAADSVLFGQALLVTDGATVTLAEILHTAPGYAIRGMNVTGTGDGYFTIQVNSSTVLSTRIRSTQPTSLIELLNGIAVATGSVVALKVTNESGNTASYDGSLLGT